MMQPETTSGAVAKPNSSAPSSAAMTTSRPVLSWPSHCTTIRSRRPLSSSVCWVSARPSSQGPPACLSEVSGEAPVPPSWPEIRTTSACALETPAATVPTPDLGDQLHVHPRGRVRVLQVVDELGEVLDRVDVVVRRRRDQPHAGRAVPGLGHPRVDLVAGQLAALAGLGALRHLDLDVVGVGEVLRGHAEAAGGDLLDRAAALGVVEPVGVLAALAGVRLAAEPVHRDREGLVGLLADRAVGHRAGGEPLDDLGDRLDLVDRDRGATQRVGVLEAEQAAQRHQPLGLLVDARGVLLEDVVAPGAGGVLEPEDRLGVEQVRLALAAPLVLAAHLERAVRRRQAVDRVGRGVAPGDLLGDGVEADAAELARRCR